MCIPGSRSKLQVYLTSILIVVVSAVVFSLHSIQPVKFFAILSEMVVIGVSLVAAYLLGNRELHKGIPLGLIFLSISTYFDLLEALTETRVYEFVSVVLLVIGLPMLLISAFYHIKERKKRISEFRAVVNNSLDGILLLGLSGEILHPNRAACSLLGYSSDELMKKQVSDLLSEDSEKKFEKAKSSLFAGKNAFQIELELITARQFKLVAEVNLVIGRDTKEDPDSFLMTFKDVTHLRKIESTLIEQNKFQRLLNELITEVLESDFDEKTYRYFLMRCVEVFPKADAAAFLLKKEDNRYHFVATHNYDFEKLKTVSFSSDELIQKGSGDVVIIKDYSVDYQMDGERLEKIIKGGRLEEIKSTLSIPIKIDDDIRMYFNLDSFTSSTAFDDKEVVNTAIGFGKAISVLLWRIQTVNELRRQRKLMEKLSLEDHLTGLPNRRAFFDCAERQVEFSKRKSEAMALLYLDLNDFKGVNDTLGHDVGDELLKSVGKRLSTVCRRSDLIARMGGDEFVYVLPSTGKKGSREAETRIHQAFEDPFSVKGRSLKLTASVGIAVFPDDGKTIRELLIVADEKMYENKEKLSRESKRVTIT
ncbi:MULTISPECIES: GGDEF domain-containing protein [Mesotoga]|uniref:GGDEF domain-containing protein n=1 Tax=Mesotoga TaxID=1184396 RepID=UPI000EF13912|nr:MULTISPECIES: diguanylate cyclase [Mesotoga]RLL84353.1 diguanylate cyclase [Mesotoga sp. H07pep.5.4]HNQ70686.1 diguanylate cyclase [Mesotoga prima]HNS76396.1 diguanylate cyclase [Mesotoga prima]HQC14131.1 diguanylate cyclase [Mesotoga prima]